MCDIHSSHDIVGHDRDTAAALASQLIDGGDGPVLNALKRFTVAIRHVGEIGFKLSQVLGLALPNLIPAETFPISHVTLGYAVYGVHWCLMAHCDNFGGFACAA